MTSEIIKGYRHKYRNYDLKDKKADEEIILVLRRHWLTFIFKFTPLIMIVFLLAITHFFLLDIIQSWHLLTNNNLLFFSETLLLMFLWLTFFILWIDFYFDAWVITNHRIIDIDQLGLFQRNVSELDLSRIQDVTTEIHGVLPTLLKYGYVYIQTAGKKTRFVFKEISDPMMVRRIIVHLQKETNKKQRNISRSIT